MIPICFDCVHLDSRERASGEGDPTVFYCKAFPFGGPGIPKEIVEGEFSHAEASYPGDSGIMYEPRPLPTLD